jgi:hypothetical protein
MSTTITSGLDETPWRTASRRPGVVDQPQQLELDLHACARGDRAEKPERRRPGATSATATSLSTFASRPFPARKSLKLHPLGPRRPPRLR